MDAEPQVCEAITNTRKGRTLLGVAEAFVEDTLTDLADETLMAQLQDIWALVSGLQNSSSCGESFV